ncbi:MAG: signal transduction histidine kinase [Crocinitomix sp.]|jgi:signal transduction histidine kinase
MNDENVLIPVVASTLLMGMIIVFVIYFIILYRKKQRNFQQERDAFKQALLRTEIEIKEQTLGNVSRELHDNLGQIAALIKMNLSRLNIEKEPDNELLMNDSVDLLKNLIADIKDLSVSLKGENLNRFGLIKMAEIDFHRYQNMGQFKIYFKHNFEAVDLALEKQIFVYRMIQEILNNILNHAQATEVHVQLHSNQNQTTLKIEDNGVGFDTKQQAKGSGLMNLEERCRLINAELNIKSEVGTGTSISIQINNKAS